MPPPYRRPRRCQRSAYFYFAWRSAVGCYHHDTCAWNQPSRTGYSDNLFDEVTRCSFSRQYYRSKYFQHSFGFGRGNDYKSLRRSKRLNILKSKCVLALYNPSCIDRYGNYDLARIVKRKAF